MQITAAMVKELREKSGAGMMDCKKALNETSGNLDKAVEYLREKGMANAAKKSDRLASEGLVESYIHTGGRIGVLIEVNCETDFVAKTDDFKGLVRNIAMQVAAMNPTYVRREEIPAEEVAREQEILKQQVIEEGKPAHIAEKIVEGRLEKHFKEVCLMDQAYVKENDKSIDQLVREQIARIGENISVRRFVRYELGEGLEKRQEDFAQEVMSQIKPSS